MTTKIQDVYAQREAAWIGRAVPNSGVYIGIDKHREFRRDVIIPRAEFIAAIETELDGTFISHADLPEVEPVSPHALRVGDGHYSATFDNHFNVARERIAAARYLDANPPIDEAAVEATIKELQAADEDERLDSDDLARIARRLVARRTTVKTEAGDDR